MLTNAPYASPERSIVALIDRNVSIKLARLIEQQFCDGATVEDVQRQLTAALVQIGRVNKYCAQREEA